MNFSQLGKIQELKGHMDTRGFDSHHPLFCCPDFGGQNQSCTEIARSIFHRFGFDKPDKESAFF